jgi:hypothetical protein
MDLMESFVLSNFVLFLSCLEIRIEDEMTVLKLIIVFGKGGRVHMFGNKFNE